MGKLKSVEELFEGRHFDREIIILCVRWYLRFKLSLRDRVESGRARPVDGAHDHHALGAALRTRVSRNAGDGLLRHRQTVVKPSRHSNDQE